MVKRFKKSDLFYLIRKFYAIDKINNNKNILHKINEIIEDSFDAQNSLLKSSLNSLSESFCKGLLKDTNIVDTPINKIRKILFAIKGMKELNVIIDKAE